MAFQIRYGLGGGFGGCGEWEDCESLTLEEAEEYAYECACEVYEMYDGLYGLRSIDEIMEEEGYNENEAFECWVEERESWLDYEAREVD